MNLDYTSLQNTGSSLGCAGFMAFDHTTDVVEAVLNLSHFYSHESCGQCTPCREGGHWIEKVFHRIAAGEGQPGDLQLIESLCNQIGGHTICAFGDTMIMPYRSFIRKFKDQFKERISEVMRGVERERTPLNFEHEGVH